MADFNFDFIDHEKGDEAPRHDDRLIEVTASLESIGHLAKKICGIWGTAELDAFLSTLILDSRDGKRAGFPMETAAELLLLIDINKMIRAMDAARDLGIPFDEAFKLIDDKDQRGRKADSFDDPQVSMDTIIKHPPRSGQSGSQKVVVVEREPASFASVLLALAQNKILIGLIAVALFIKLVWPMIRGG